jgi:hypothetical protein
MALRCFSRADGRQVILGMLTAGYAAVFPMEAGAIPAETEKAYVAFFLGQGGYLFSWGIPLLESEARKIGLATDVFRYTDVNAASAEIVRRRKDGYKIALVGYSLGNTTATYLQRYLTIDLLLAISESSLGRNHPIKKKNTKRSVLWYGPDMLSNAGVHDGFNETNYIDRSHLLMDLDPRVVRGVLDELQRLVTPERRDEQTVVANAPVPAPIVPSTKESTATVPTSTQPVSTGWSLPINTITPDVTCTICWGFEQSLGEGEPDTWMR